MMADLIVILREIWESAVPSHRRHPNWDQFWHNLETEMEAEDV